MMNLRLDWDKIRKVHDELSESATLHDNSNLIFVTITAKNKVKKSIIKFKNFMNFLWGLSEQKTDKIINLIIQDQEGRVLYRHKTLTRGNEEIPVGGNVNVIPIWRTLTQDEKDMYVRLMEAQIQSYE